MLKRVTSGGHPQDIVPRQHNYLRKWWWNVNNAV